MMRPRGTYLTRQEASTCYALIRHNVRTYESAGVVEVIKGRQNAEAAMGRFEQEQTSEDHRNGWRYLLVEENKLTPGMDPQEATRRRQMDLEDRESEAPPMDPSPSRRG
jgi:hypothetical protein